MTKKGEPKRDAEEEQSTENGSAFSASGDERKRKRGPMAGENLELNALETTVSGQLEMNPNLSVEEARAAAKKEYNRRNSARSRVRSKKMVSHLQEECARLSRREKDLLRENEKLRSELDMYKKREALGPSQLMMSPQLGQGAFNAGASLRQTMNQGGLPGAGNMALPAQLASLQGGVLPGPSFNNVLGALQMSGALGPNLLLQQQNLASSFVQSQGTDGQVLPSTLAGSHPVSEMSSDISGGTDFYSSSQEASFSQVQQRTPPNAVEQEGAINGSILAQLSPQSRSRVLESMKNM